ncbi:RNase P/RNase MRP complex subunit [Sporobolomyces koalae]|uniref:RNase P/RNase MRP complex subunit n=1 Tax=Sporobolomyces koalae TaxID=500713 RepID=UPI0031737C98
MSTAAPAIGGASTSLSKPASSTRPRRSAWDPYAPLPPATKRKLDPKDALQARSYLESLQIPTQVADERVSGKLIQLDPPLGKVSDQRKAELAVKDQERDKKRLKRAQQGDCGLGGRRKRTRQALVESVNYAAVLPVHHLWLGYMAELLALPIVVPKPCAESSLAPTPRTQIPLPTFPSRSEPLPPAAQQLSVNVVNIQTKLVKAEFVGSFLTVKRAKNPSLVGIEGIVLQETQGTFKLVTAKSQIKVIAKQGSVFTLAFRLSSKPGSVASPTNATTELCMDLFGDSFAYRSAERVGRKWKAGTSAGGVELV